MDTAKIAVELENVEKTLLLPLWGRAKASRMSNPVIVDNKAMELVDRMDIDFNLFNRHIDLFQIISLAMRAKRFDSLLTEFIKSHDSASVVNIGAGLDTAFCRISENNVKWYDVDMPQVINLRKQLIPETANMTEISKSMFDESFLNEIDDSENTIFVISGVLMYFDEAKVKSFLDLLASRFRKAEIILDVLSPLSVRYYNRLLKNAGFNGAVMKWGIHNKNNIESWNPRLQIISSYPYYLKTDQFGSLPFLIKLKIRFSNLFSLAGIVHMKIA